MFNTLFHTKGFPIGVWTSGTTLPMSSFMLPRDSIYDFSPLVRLNEMRASRPPSNETPGVSPQKPKKPLPPSPNLFLYIFPLVELNSPSPNVNTIYIVLHSPGLRAPRFFRNTIFNSGTPSVSFLHGHWRCESSHKNHPPPSLLFVCN